jgi:hypothetical protein
MTTALDRLKNLWRGGEHRKALKLAASWPKLGDHKAAIQQGWAAAANPDLYRQMEKDPDALYAAGLVALMSRYKLPKPIESAKRRFNPNAPIGIVESGGGEDEMMLGQTL